MLDPIGNLKIELVRVGVFRGQLMSDQRQVDDRFEIDVSSLEDVSTIFSSFASDCGFPETPLPQLRRYQNGIHGISIVKQEPNEWTVLQVSLHPKEPEMSEEEKEIQRIEKEEDVATTRIFRVWRQRLDMFKKAQSELPLDPKDRTKDQHEKWLQLKGAIDSVSAFLTDLQKIRSVNQSVLNM